MMDFTGERYVPEVHGNIELEHIHRYLMASKLVAKKKVLDIACGEGYGSAMLAQEADQVSGMDISIETIQFARKRYLLKNLDFKVGSCTDIPLPDASVDVVVSFETIEHIDQHDQMLKEIIRVLRSEGLLIISSPDKYYYSNETGYNNQFHKKELYEHEFKQLLGDKFKQCAFFKQRVIYGSSIFSEMLKTFMTGYFHDGEIIRQSAGISKPTYWIGLASDSPLPELHSSIFEQPINESEVVKSWSSIVFDRDKTIQQLQADVAEREQSIQLLQADVAQRDQSIQQLQADVAERDQSIQQLQADVAEREQSIQQLQADVTEREQSIQLLQADVAQRDQSIQQLQAVVAERDQSIQQLQADVAEREQDVLYYALSKSWRMTRPLRKIMKLFRGKKNV